VGWIASEKTLAMTGIVNRKMKQLNFERKLIDWYEKNKGRKIKWGMFDCATSVLEAVEIVYGERIVPPDLWSSRKEAIKIYKNLYSPVQSFIDAGFEIGKYPCTGDVLVLKTSPMNTCCVVINKHYTVIDEKEGLQLRKISDAAGNYTILRRSEIRGLTSEKGETVCLRQVQV